MGRYLTETNHVIRVDDQFIDADQIAYISAITSGHELDENLLPSTNKYFVFHVMLVGHSNVIHFTDLDELTIKLKRKYIIEEWTMSTIVSISHFDLEKQLDDITSNRFNPDDPDFIFLDGDEPDSEFEGSEEEEDLN